MKDIKPYIIGFLVCAVLFLVKGAVWQGHHNQIGRFISLEGYLLDTTNGAMYTGSFNETNKKRYWVLLREPLELSQTSYGLKNTEGE